MRKPDNEGVYDGERRRRDTLIQGVQYQLDPATKQELHEALDIYLASVGKRKTLERYMVLDEIYGIDRPLDTETLYAMIQNDQGPLCQASVYNILGVLVDSGLVRKLDLLEGKRSFYERTRGETPHGYAVCEECGTLRRLDLGRLLTGMHNQLARGFVPNDTLLIVRGECARCRRKKGKK